MKFIDSVIDEMHKVTWPTFNENVRDTTIVLLTSAFFGLFLGGVDWLLQQGITFLSN
ncbi:preprotein translocase subunit SecE [Weissella halotolerans]|uniref:Protein translocase subunit SecE n=1 Tax=Weissella halotolerans DSM 20190 TaxID=1123500 RepID=A0A0R2G6L1_9LACO|nr:preprotein translocase subunit SecE [Weissella halotolerans]KRN32365.1 hypothetical protein IV68_GL000716 [Weissella halotolerans DSM 20190]